MSTINANKFKMAWVLPATLCLFGGRGTVVSLAHMAQDLGLEFECDEIKAGAEFVPSEYDFIYFQPGQLDYVNTVKDALASALPALDEYVNDGGYMLVESSSVPLFGKQIAFADGRTATGFGWLDFSVRERKLIESNDLLFAFAPQGEFKNEMLKTLTVTPEQFCPTTALQQNVLLAVGAQISRFAYEDIGNVPALGQALYSVNGASREGFQRNNAWFTNAIGPLLFLNAHIAYYLIDTIVSAKGGVVRELSSQFLYMAAQAINARVQYIASKSPEIRAFLHPDTHTN